jgi:hypothetical protein
MAFSGPEALIGSPRNSFPEIGTDPGGDRLQIVFKGLSMAKAGADPRGKGVGEADLRGNVARLVEVHVPIDRWACGSIK